ncbi:MAG: hypothetical protein GY835_18525 [bacterium]|nr:hypothetical protein [bacterium]
MLSKQQRNAIKTFCNQPIIWTKEPSSNPHAFFMQFLSLGQQTYLSVGLPHHTQKHGLFRGVFPKLLGDGRGSAIKDLPPCKRLIGLGTREDIEHKFSNRIGTGGLLPDTLALDLPEAQAADQADQYRGYRELSPMPPKSFAQTVSPSPPTRQHRPALQMAGDVLR